MKLTVTTFSTLDGVMQGPAGAEEDTADGFSPRRQGAQHLAQALATRNPGTILTWANSHAIRGDVVEAVRALKGRPGRELQVHGSHGLIQTLLGTGLVDQFNVLTLPVVVGHGKRLFGTRDAAFSLKLLSSEVTPKGIIVARYENTGVLGQPR